MSLERLKIFVEDARTPIPVLFNPNQLSFHKSACWRQARRVGSDVSPSQFLHGEPATLKVDLFFDTYADGKDVRQHTQKIYHLTTVQDHGELHRPPLCRLAWGRFDFDHLQWVLTDLDQRFTLFLANGLPARATLSCSFREWRSDEVEGKLAARGSPDLEKSHTVRRGDTLSAIAGGFYGDPAQWRPIAEANSIDDPRRLEIGRTLRIPKLTDPRPREA